MQIKTTYSVTVLSTAFIMLLGSGGCYSGIELNADETSDGQQTSSGADPGSTTNQGSTGEQASIDEYILGLGHFTLPPEEPLMEKECEKDCLPDTAECSYTYYHGTEHFGDFVAFQPNSATLWPGAIVRGEDAQYGLLTPISLPRAPLTFSFSLENLIASPVATMQNPTLSAFRELRNQILQEGVEGNAPAAMNLDISQVTSVQSLSRLFKTDVSWGKENGNKITGMFDFLSEDSGYQLAVDFNQAYYTIDIDTPAAPSELFDPGVTLEEVQKFMGVENPPMYVQSITFGRRAVMSIKTKHSLDKVKTAFSVAIKSVVDVDTKVDTETIQLLDSLDMKVFLLGGSGSDTVQAISGFQGLIKFIQDGAEYSMDSPGAPIAYKLAYLDNTGTKFAYTTDFAEAHCTPQMTMVVHGNDLVFDSNGEGWGKAELTYYAKVTGSNQEPCFFVNQTSDIHHADGDSRPLGVDCKFTFKSDEPAELTIELWAKEYGGAGDSTQTASSSTPFTYDPVQMNWQPGINGQNFALKASHGKGLGDDLAVTFNYSIDQL